MVESEEEKEVDRPSNMSDNEFICSAKLIMILMPADAC